MQYTRLCVGEKHAIAHVRYIVCVGEIHAVEHVRIGEIHATAHLYIGEIHAIALVQYTRGCVSSDAHSYLKSRFITLCALFYQ